MRLLNIRRYKYRVLYLLQRNKDVKNKEIRALFFMFLHKSMYLIY